MVRLEKRDRFYELAPGGAFYLDTNVTGLESYLRRRGWLEGGEFVTAAEMAGQGNMNCIVRVVTHQRTFILKQSRPWVEKYAHIAAPFDRALVEAEFYHLVSATRAAEFMPKLHWVDAESRIVCLDDLGALGDFTNMYRGVPINAEELEQLCRFLSLLHSSRGHLVNREMRVLNHFHIFAYPFQAENGLDLDQFTPGLGQIGQSVKSNRALGSRITELGQLYLSEGDYLLHGDYFPGSWLRDASCVKVIDPEFGFSGPREFDLGVMLGHLVLSGMDDAAASLGSHYAYWKDLDHGLIHSLAGVEILRRLLGVAQLPITFGLERKRKLLEEAVRMVLA